MVCLCCKDEALKGPKGLWDTGADVLSAGGQSQTPRGSESLGV